MNRLGARSWKARAAALFAKVLTHEVKSEAGIESPVADWPALFNVPAFREFCAATIKADEAERLAERED